MSGPQQRSLWVSVLMVASAVLAIVLRPQVIPADHAVDLEALFPSSFGSWREDPSIRPVEPAPGDQAIIERIYTQTLARAYVSAEGRQVMLSVAYGAAQSDSLKVHQPELCYRSQGFDVTESFGAILPTLAGRLPVMRFVASKPARNEPVTYWMVIGERPVRTGWEAKLATLRYAMSGIVPDGFLVRVSGIDNSDDTAFALEQRFISDLLEALNNDARARIIGKLDG
jgi:EpsI family protein